ncbi:RNA polymerase factor sigma-54 [Allorhizobium sp. BGMRC 0089]|uniref:RNA polymerase factor sigma-54 n=1 Tax=Allorhizobium sonneratiae TaxID=2934936 RepID=UPI002033BEEC|nr:RNA polymerase factor sigma-54 [Allorhizobium sonneratiae]MCM2291578.1 RNA polymerase factor sigma-54 [Allorhizobium sonneratiae]
MALSANLFLRQSQSLVMTPQLMQSIQLLQMTHFELLQFISQEVEKNPLLEIAAGEQSMGNGEDLPPSLQEMPTIEDGSPVAAESLSSDWYEETGEAHLQDRLDANFDGVFTDDGVRQAVDAPDLLGQWKSMPGGTGEAGEGYDLDDFVAGRLSLRDHIEQQIPFAVSGNADRLIARALCDHLDEAGYLRTELADIAEPLGTTVSEVERVLTLMQQLEPAGVFARNLGECLEIQLRQRNRLDPAMAMLLNHLDLLAKRDFVSLKRLCGVDEDDLIDMLAEIRRLCPKPGANFDSTPPETVAPDIHVFPGKDGTWHVELNSDTLPRVLVNNAYYAQVKRHGIRQEGDQAFITDCLNTANWLTRSLDQRAKTILKVATEIVRQQDAFLRHGVDHLRPLNLKTVADAIKMHESTVSRVTSNKYMLTPRGLFELKYFFSVSISSAEGGDSHSAEAVRHKIKTLISQEEPQAILSDDDIVDLLKSAGIDLARRTVAKYREAMNIPSSVQRRREKRAMAKT